MEQRHPHSSTASSSHRRRRRNGAALFIATAAALAVQVQHASAAVMVGNGNSNGGINARHINHHSLQSRQYPSEAPACAQTCIRVKIEEAADPGLATECDYRTSGYVACLCASSKFTAAYERCLLDNCIFPSSLATGRSLFQTFCSATPSQSEVSQAVSIASSAVASQASIYSQTATLNSTTSGTGTSTSSGATTSGASTAATTATSGQSSGTSNPGTSSQASGTNTGSSTTRSSSSLTPDQIASARANATGVSAAHHLRNSVSSWTLAASSALVLLGSLVVLA